MLETRKKTLGSTTYRVTQLQAHKGYKVLLRLTKALGPALSAGALGDTAGAISKLVENIDEETADYLVDTFKKTTEIELPNGNSIDLEGQFNLHFAGKYGEMMQWLGFCVEVNFSDFLGALKPKPAVSQASAPANPSS